MIPCNYHSIHLSVSQLFYIAFLNIPPHSLGHIYQLFCYTCHYLDSDHYSCEYSPVRMFLYHILSHRVSQYIPVYSLGHTCQWICCMSRHSYSAQHSSEHSQHHRFLVDILYYRMIQSIQVHTGNKLHWQCDIYFPDSCLDRGYHSYSHKHQG